MTKRMIKLVALVTAASTAVLGGGCDSGSMNRALNRQSVVAKYSTEVWNLPDEKYRFVARKPDGSVWYVETMTSDENKLISAETQLFPAMK